MAKETSKTPKGSKGDNRDKRSSKTNSTATTVTDFPRGGSNGLTPLEFREVTRQAEREAIFSDGVTSEKKDKKKRRSAENGESAKQTKSRKKKSKSAEKNSAADGDASDTDLLDDARLAKVENLTTKKLSKGALVLGCVSAIYELELSIALPNGVTGTVPITSISPEMTAFVEKAAGDAESDSEDADAMDVDASDKDDPLDLSTRFFVGQFVKCVVVEVGNGDRAAAADKSKKKNSSSLRVELSLAPEEINNRIDPDDVCEGMILTASIKSVEDRGYVLNTGLPGKDVAAFLPSNAAQSWLERWMPDAEELKVGQLVEAAVTSVSADRRSMRFTIDPKVVSECMVQDTYKTMASIQPGQLVQATIMKVWDSGLSLRFMGFYDCSANLKSIGMFGASNKSEVGKEYPFGDTIKVRVLYVSLTAAAKTILVSTNPHILQLRSRPAPTGYELPNAACLAAGRAPVPQDSAADTKDVQNEKATTTKSAIADMQMWPIPYGTVLEDCVVVNTVGSNGLALKIAGVDSVQAYAAVSQLVDEGEDAPALNKYAGRFCIGTHHRARVVGYDAIDATMLLSLRPSAVNNTLFSINDLRPGMLVTGTVRTFNEKGAVVDLTPQIRGFAFKEDLSDIPLKHPELQFKPGKEIVCRVSKVIWDQNKITLTARKSLVKSKLPVVWGYTEEEGAVPGAIVQATVIRAVKNGFVASLYQGTVCLIHSEARAPAVGQVIKCRIMKVNSDKRHILASLNIDPDTTVDALVHESSLNSVRSEFSKDVSQVSVGQLVSGSVVSVGEKTIKVCIDGSSLLAFLHVGHLSDHRGDVLDKILSRIAVGNVLEELVITSTNEKRGVVNVSAKKSLIKAAKAKCMPASAADLVVGSTCVGWVEAIVEYGAFVSFLGSYSALVPLEHISDRFVTSAKDILDVDQTVVASIVSVDQADGEYKVRASLKESGIDITATGCLEPTDLLEDYFDSLETPEGDRVLESIGSQALVSVKQKHPYGVVVAPVKTGSPDALSEITSGLVMKQQAKDRINECAGNAVIAACVLDVDSEKSIADYSLRSALVPHSADLEKAAAEGDHELFGKVLEKYSSRTATNQKALHELYSSKAPTQLLIELVKEDYLVLSMPHLGNAIGFAVTKTYNNRSKPFMRFKPGQRLSGTIARVEQNKRTLVQLDTTASRSKNSAVVYGAEFTDIEVVKPVDPAVKRFGDYSEGSLTVARVTAIEGNQANLEFGSNVKGRLHITELFDSDANIDADVKDAESVFAAAGVCPGKTVNVKVLGVCDGTANKFLPIAHTTPPTETILEATIRGAELKDKGSIAQFRSRLVALRTAKGGHAVRGFIRGIGKSKDTKQPTVIIDLGIHISGVIPLVAATSDFAVVADPSSFFVPGMPIEVQIAKMDTASKEAQLAPYGKYIAGVSKPFESLEELKPGTHVIASVSKIMESVMFVNIELAGKVASSGMEYRSVRVSGKVDVFNATDRLSENVFAGFSKDQLVEAVVLSSASGKEGKKPTVKLSIRPSVVDPSKNVAESVVDPRISSVADIHAGQVVHGFVEKTTNVGCFVLLGPRFSARALISELTDEYVRDVAAAFPAGKFVTAIVMSTNPERNQVAISLKPSRIGNVTDAAGNVKRRLDQISVGETLKGTVSRIEEYGVFIKADDAFVNGLCYVREIADSDVPVDPKALYEIGDRVLAKVLKVDIKANRLALGLKTSYFAKDGEEKSGDEDSEASSDEDEEAADNNEGAMSVDDEAESSDDEASGSDSDGMDVDDAAVSSLPVANGFKWDDAEDDSDGSAEQERDSAADSDDESDGETAQSTKKNKSLKRSKLSHIAQDITADLSEQAPKRAVDFERLIVGSPNSSFLWLQFMAFYLGQSEVDQARDVAERALKTIFMSEVQEKMNIWVALLNLEHRFGSTEALEATLKRAAQYMNPKHIYLQMAKIYERADQPGDAERMHKVAVSKFSGSCKVWVLFGLFYLKSGKISESRDLLARALKALPKRKHIKAITQFGQMEFKSGEPERGRTVFEGVLGTYPKRVDLWSVYLDMEVKAVTSRGLHTSDASGKCWSNARTLFERVTSMKFSSKKMKFLFKKWLGFEKTHGTEATIEHVKDRALEYINSLGS